MKRYLEILKRARIFNGLNEQEILFATNCLEAKIRHFSKDEVIFSDGDKAGFVGVILKGQVRTQKIDYNGNVNIVSTLQSTDIIAASACYSSDRELPFDIVCALPSDVMCMDIARFIRPCCNVCSFHIRLIENTLNSIADRNIMLARKINILSKRSIREKVLSYLFTQSKIAKSKMFTIPLSRRQMAEYLSTDRSALSRELGNLRDEGIIEFEGNSFRLN